MNKSRLHHLWTKIRTISYWYFFAAFVVSLTIGVIALRNNNLQAIELREKVLQVDEEDGDVEAALRELREFVYSHMNADLAGGTGIQHPVQLVHRYERLREKEQTRVEKANESIYPRAQAICEQRIPASVSGGPRVACIEDYVLQNGVKEKSIPDALYKFDFVSPRWSFDLAGISLLLSAIFFFLFIVRFGIEWWLKTFFKNHA